MSIIKEELISRNTLQETVDDWVDSIKNCYRLTEEEAEAVLNESLDQMLKVREAIRESVKNIISDTRRG